MICGIEIALKKELKDAQGISLKKKAASYFSILIQDARCIDIVTIESNFDEQKHKKTRELKTIRIYNNFDIKGPVMDHWQRPIFSFF